MTHELRIAARTALALIAVVAAFLIGFAWPTPFPCAEDEWHGHSVGCVHQERIGPDGTLPDIGRPRR